MEDKTVGQEDWEDGGGEERLRSMKEGTRK